MNEELDRVHLSKVAQDGFTALLQSLHEAGASEQEALTLVLGLAQLKAHLAGVVIEHAMLPGEVVALLN